MSMRIQDVEKLQDLYPDHQIELREGKILIQPPSDLVSGEIGARFTMLLGTWVYNHDLGRVLGASTGILMPNGDLLSPHFSFVAREQLKQTSRTYLSVVPQLVVEIKSSRDRVRGLEEKITLFLSQGVQVGILIDPDKHLIRIYHAGGLSKDADTGESIPQGTTLRDSDTLTIPELFPGWEVPIMSLWPVVYE